MDGGERTPLLRGPSANVSSNAAPHTSEPQSYAESQLTAPESTYGATGTSTEHPRSSP
jgi:hypothetical protein